MAIVDTLVLVPSELMLIKVRYPKSRFTNLDNSGNILQEYRVIIEDEVEEPYYTFLLAHGLAPSSEKFRSRLGSDKSFADQVKTQIYFALRA